MMYGNGKRTTRVRAAFAAGALALALGACSDGGDGNDPGVPGPADDPVAGPAGTGAFAAADGSADAVTDGALADPFAAPDAAANPDSASGGRAGDADQTTDDGAGDDPFGGPDGDAPGGDGTTAAPGPVEDDVEAADVPPANPFVVGQTDEGGDAQASGPVLDDLQNRFVDAENFDLWLCEVPDAPEIAAVGYLFVDSDGALVIVPEDGSETATFGFTASEQSPGTLVNAYAEAGISETLDGFVFGGEDAFVADSDVFGALGCERFTVDGESVDDEEPVAPLVTNAIDGTGTLSDLWVCRGPQVQADGLVYVFLDGGQGVFATIEGEAEPEPIGFEWVESAPGTLDLVYEGGVEERLEGFAFDGELRFDATSSYEGALSCELLEI